MLVCREKARISTLGEPMYIEADLSRPLHLPKLDGRSITHVVYAVFAPSPGQQWDAVSDHPSRNPTILKAILQ
jgi:hypothetical protein